MAMNVTCIGPLNTKFYFRKCRSGTRKNKWFFVQCPINLLKQYRMFPSVGDSNVKDWTDLQLIFLNIGLLVQNVTERTLRHSFDNFIFLTFFFGRNIVIFSMFQYPLPPTFRTICLYLFSYHLPLNAVYTVQIFGLNLLWSLWLQCE
jgi:hypothetical protein